MCWLLFMCFVWPLKVLQTDSVLWKAFIELSQLRQTVLWEVSSPSSTDLELFSLRETEPLVTSVGSFGRWDTVVAAGACGAASHQEQNSASWLWSWEWPVCVLCCQGAFPCTWQFVVLAVEVLCPVSSTKKKKQWSGRKHPRGCWVGSTVTFPSHWTYCCIMPVPNECYINNTDCLNVSKPSRLCWNPL